MSKLRFQALIDDPRVAQARALLQQALAEHSAALTGVAEPDPDLKAGYDEAVAAFGEMRGRALYFPYLGSGLGRGPLVELGDGSVKYDFISGIGAHAWGHSHPEMLDAGLDAALGDTIMQGNLQQNPISADVCRLLIDGANRGEAKGRFSHCFLTTTGAMANENALKILFQHRHPAYRVLAFAGCFMGRTLAMSNLTDKHAGRVGLPRTLSVDYIPFYNPEKPEASTRHAVSVLRKHIERYPGQHAAMAFELVLGEGGYYTGTHDFFKALMEVCHEHDISVLIDEIQTFGRTPQLFAFQHLGLDQWVDAVSVGKLSQVCATVFTHAINPKPGLLSQTFTGASSSLHAAKVILEGLRDGGFHGPDGRNQHLHDHFVAGLQAIGERHPGWIDGPFGVGAMVGVTPFGGDAEANKKLVMKLYDNGVLGFGAGKKPSRMRFLMPLGVVTTEDIDAVLAIFEQTMVEVAEDQAR